MRNENSKQKEDFLNVKDVGNNRIGFNIKAMIIG